MKQYDGTVEREVCKCGCGAIRDTYIRNDGSILKRVIQSPHSHRYKWGAWKPKGEQIYFTFNDLKKKGGD